MKKKLYNVAIAGATGVVGKEFLKILEERKFPVGEIRLLASERSAGAKLEFKGKEELVRLLDEETFDGVDIGLFSPGASVSAKHAPRAGAAGCIVIDNTSQFRMDPDVPLVVPEVNPEAVKAHRDGVPERPAKPEPSAFPGVRLHRYEMGDGRHVVPVEGMAHAQYKAGQQQKGDAHASRSVKEKEAPPPRGLSAQILPPCFSTICLAIESPNPVPASVWRCLSFSTR